MHRIAHLILLTTSLVILAGCQTPESARSFTVPTPSVEYSQPEFHPTFEPPMPIKKGRP